MKRANNRPIRRANVRTLTQDDRNGVSYITVRTAIATGVALTIFAASNVIAQTAVKPVSSPGAAASSAAADAAYDRAAKSWSALKSVEARFEQKITNPLLGRTATSRGTFIQQRPGKVSITFTDPVGDRIVGDGKFLWVYLPSSAPNQVMKLPANAEGAVVADMLGQLLDTPRRTFTISGGEAATIDGRATRRVQLVPRTAGSVPFQRATLWIDDKESRPVRVQVVDQQGVDRTITMNTWAPNAAVPKDAFRFSVPKGAKVLTRMPG
jgi:outer membrane lipoprotein carrier protein